MSRKITVFLIILLAIQSLFLVVHASSGEIDEITACEHVIDGDTFNTTTLGKVRLADINSTNDDSTFEYYEAKGFLEGLLFGRQVYLDNDEYPNGTYRRDPNRLVSIVYVEYNSTHYMNVNQALLESKHANITDYTNNFNPYTWTLYVSKDEVPIVPEFPSFLVLWLFMVIALLVAGTNRRKKAV
jgi:endonuclease YncB( thermonuclease family)